MTAVETEPEAPASESTPDAEAEAMAALDRVRLPVQTLAEAIPHLRRPFTPEAIRFKVQTVFANAAGCIVVAYIDARLASERLNRVIPGGWTAEYKPVDGSKLMWCRLTVDGVSRTDVGESSKGMSKDLVSDALKRAAVHFGVAVSCYALPEIKLMAGTPHVRQKTVKTQQGEKMTLLLTEHGMVKLREGYAKWLADYGVKRFGPALDHGDVVGATIAEEYELGTGEGSGEPPEWEGVSEEHIARAEALIARAKEVDFPLFAEEAVVRMTLNKQSEAAVEEFIAAGEEQLGMVEPGGES